MTIDTHRKMRGRCVSLALLTLISLTAIVQTVSAQQPQADNTYIEGAVLWQQTSGERRALSYQAFALARLMLDQDFRVNRRNRKPRAVVVDLDETILDNGRYEAKLLQDRVNYPQGWTEWINRAEATAVP